MDGEKPAAGLKAAICGWRLPEWSLIVSVDIYELKYMNGGPVMSIWVSKRHSIGCGSFPFERL